MRPTDAPIPLPSLRRRWVGLLTVLALAVLGTVVAPVVATTAVAAEPPTPIAAPFDAPLCENTTGTPAVDADGGPVTNLLSVFGQRLADYNAGQPVVLYNNTGRSGWTSSGSQYASNPICVVRYVDEVSGPVSSWSYCTFDRASVCSWTNEDGELERGGTVLPGLEVVDPDGRLTPEQQLLQAYIAQNDIPVAPGPNGTGGTVTSPIDANDDTTSSRTLRQNLIHCIDNPNRNKPTPSSPDTDFQVFCAANMGQALQARILEIVGPAAADQLAATGPAATVLPGADGEISVVSTLAGVPLELAVTGGTVSLCAGEATLVGTTLTVDDGAVLPAELTLCATRADAGDVTVAISGVPPVPANLGYVQTARFDGDTLCQIFSGEFVEHRQPITASATARFADDVPAPVIGTSLVDAADGDRIVPSAGGVVIDTVAYEHLVPDTEYTVSGELMVKATGAATGITGSTTFTSSGTGTGSVDVEFTIPAGWAGESLVAFEVLSQGGADVASHEDIDDQAQTVFVEDGEPFISTTLVDGLDGDRSVAQSGGTVIDTVAYTGLEPDTEHTVSGELMDRETGAATGIVGSTTFTSSSTGTGSVDVAFVIDGAWAGRSLVAFEVLTLGGDEIASHEDLADAAQTVWIADIGTTLVDEADGDHSVAWDGGVVIDTVAYVNLAPETLHTLTGELMVRSTGAGTGITGTVDFTSSATGDGSVEVEFTIPSGWAGESLVAFEVLTQGGVEIAVHEDLADEGQTVAVEAQPLPLIGTTLVDAADGDKLIPSAGGTVVDTVAYEHLVPETAYTVSGQLVDKATGLPTGIVGSAEFVSSSTGSGSVEVVFVIPTGWAGATLVAFEVLTRGDVVVATHEDIDDAAQTVSVLAVPPATSTGPASLTGTGSEPPIAAIAIAALLMLGGAALVVRRGGRA